MIQFLRTIPCDILALIPWALLGFFIWILYKAGKESKGF